MPRAIVDVVGRVKLSAVLAPVMSILFFVIGYFDFFDVLGLIFEMRVVLLGIVGLIAPPILLKGGWRAFREPLFLLAIIFLIFELLHPFARKTWLNAVFGMAVAAAIVMLVFSLDGGCSSKILKGIIALAAIFSALAIVQFFVLLLQPELIHLTINPNYAEAIYEMTGTIWVGPGGSEYEILHPIAYLGKTTGWEHFLGLEAARIHSFAREPGLLVLYFFLPGVMALTYGGKAKLLAIPLLALSVLGFTGTVYGSIFLAIFLLALVRLMRLKDNRLFLTLIPLVITVAGVIIIYTTTILDGLLRIFLKNDFVVSHMQYFGFLDIYDSATLRLSQLREFLSTIDPGDVVTGHIPGTVGLIMYGFFKASILGALLELLFLYSMFRAISGFWVASNKNLVCALLCGIYMQAGFFQQYGFTLPSAFLINALTLQRLRLLSRVESQKGRSHCN